MRAGCNRGLVNREGYIEISYFEVRVVFKGGLYLRAGSVTGFTVFKAFIQIVQKINLPFLYEEKKIL